MKNMRAGLLTRYAAALRAHVDGKDAPSSRSAQKIGRAALAGGLATLDLAEIHQQAVMALLLLRPSAGARGGSTKRAGIFFTEALIPLEADRRATRDFNQLLLQRNRTLRRHTAALAAGNRRLQREVTRRKSGEVKIEQAKERYRRLFLESQVMQDKLRQLTRQIISAQEDERKEISRELHDEVVQTLVGINVALSALSRSPGVDGHSLKGKIAHTQRLVTHSVNAVHRFARDLRPTVLDDLGLIPAVHGYSQKLAARKKIRVQMTAFAGVEALSMAGRTILFRVAQEALNNVARHAQASRVTLRISERTGAIRMEISDNGKSFPVDATLAKNNKRLGLIGMRERIEMIGGTLAIDSSPGEGTTVRADIPFKPEPKTR
jgi:signal transduction histidine kinase